MAGLRNLSIQILDNNLQQKIPSVVITANKKEYIINVPFDYLRFHSYHKKKISNNSNYFFSKIS
jgi:hypothetical protein